MTIYSFSQLILNWYHYHGRKNLPWQKKKTLYKVWISEIMLQQTSVKTVIPYFNKFIKKFPNIKILSTGSLNEILFLWSGLGYYSRANNIYKSAQIIKNQYETKFPEQFSQIIKLPGIGRTTAGAILSLTLNYFFPILDGNVKRIIIRYYGIKNITINMISEKKLWKIIELITPLYNTNKFNQGMMDIGALICKSVLPQCNICPLNISCIAFKEKNWKKYIYKKNHIINKIKKSWFIIIKYNHKLWLEINTQKNIWKNLFCFPNFDTKIMALEWLKKNNIIKTEKYKQIKPFFHLFTHFQLHIHSIIIILKNNKNIFYKNTGIWYNLNKPQKIGLPTPVQKIIKKLNYKIEDKSL
ncbi:A/G-specific adenine glycosylase [Buchnera aphidicola]|uniref:A/G-specific adenine glycosylase n=1 Tax=Buchnera aphidicola TaxID=9 RepID=UPI003BEEC994